MTVSHNHPDAVVPQAVAQAIMLAHRLTVCAPRPAARQWLGTTWRRTVRSSLGDFRRFGQALLASGALALIFSPMSGKTA